MSLYGTFLSEGEERKENRGNKPFQCLFLDQTETPADDNRQHWFRCEPNHSGEVELKGPLSKGIALLHVNISTTTTLATITRPPLQSLSNWLRQSISSSLPPSQRAVKSFNIPSHGYAGHLMLTGVDPSKSRIEAALVEANGQSSLNYEVDLFLHWTALAKKGGKTHELDGSIRILDIRERGGEDVSIYQYCLSSDPCSQSEWTEAIMMEAEELYDIAAEVVSIALMELRLKFMALDVVNE